MQKQERKIDSFTMRIRSLHASQFASQLNVSTVLQQQQLHQDYFIGSQACQNYEYCKVCSFCFKVMQPKQQNDGVYMVNLKFVQKRYYLAHRKCYDKQYNSMFILSNKYKNQGEQLKARIKNYPKHKLGTIQINVHHPISQKKICTSLKQMLFWEIQQNVFTYHQSHALASYDYYKEQGFIRYPILLPFPHAIIKIQVVFLDSVLVKKKFESTFFVEAPQLKKVVRSQKLRIEVQFEGYCQEQVLNLHQKLKKSLDQLYHITKLKIQADKVFSPNKKNQDFFSDQSSTLSKSSSESPSPILSAIVQSSSVGFGIEIDKLIEQDGLIKYMKSQVGSRYVQTYIANGNQKQRMNFVKQIRGQLRELVRDGYGNYCVKKLIQHSNQQIRTQIFKQIQQDFTNISKNKMYLQLIRGSIILQALISQSNHYNQQQRITQALLPNLTQMLTNQFSCQFLKKVVKHFNRQFIEVLVKQIEKQMTKVCISQSGLIFVNTSYQFKALIHKLHQSQKFRKLVLFQFQKNVQEIAQSMFGNIALQTVIQYFPIKELRQIMGSILSKIIMLSKQKYSSNVVQKCLLCKDENIKKQFLNVLGTSQITVQLMKNKYGSFVLQKGLGQAGGQDRRLLINSIQSGMQNIHNKQIRQKFQDILQQYI